MAVTRGGAALSASVFCWCIAAIAHTAGGAENAHSRHSQETSAISDQCTVTSIVLVGANGDLAKRYLWQAIFAHYLHHQEENGAISSGDGTTAKSKFIAISGTRKAMESAILLEMVNNSVSCGDESHLYADPVLCESIRQDFMANIVIGVQLKTEAHYSDLGKMLSAEAVDGAECAEQRLFYLAIPAFAFASTAQFIGTHCRPARNTPAASWMRVVFEKPFGHDYTSAQDLVVSLRPHLTDDEILLIDHYLGKPGVRAIQQIRSQLPPRSVLWRGSAIAQVDITVSERLDAAGRTAFYDAYGVVRDMLQNHLTSLLSLVTCGADRVGSGNGNCAASDMHSVVKSIDQINPSQVLLGQYTDYAHHCCQDDSANCGNLSRTATFAAALFHLNLPLWRDVPFKLVSGKALGERRASVTIHYKPSTFPCLESQCCRDPKLVINIQGGEHGLALSLPDSVHRDITSLPPDWEWSRDYKEGGCKYRMAKAERGVHAYSELIRSAVRAPRGQFVDTTFLLESWRAWSPIVDWLPYLPLRVYSTDAALSGYLHTTVHGRALEFSAERLVLDDAAGLAGSLGSDRLLGGRLFSADVDTMTQYLVEDIMKAAHQAVAQRGSFHLALPGGRSLRPLYLALASSSSLANSIPWQRVHVWQVDERCVSRLSNPADSNFLQLSSYLLRHRPIPPENVHAMPVSLAGGLCRGEDNGQLAYERELKEHTDGNGTMDMILLGVGSDGHIASLFPQSTISANGDLVTLSEQLSSHSLASSTRMTLTYSTIQNAHAVSLVLSGQGKADIFRQLRDADSGSFLPAARVARARQGRVTWYVEKSISAT